MSSKVTKGMRKFSIEICSFDDSPQGYNRPGFDRPGCRC